MRAEVRAGRYRALMTYERDDPRTIRQAKSMRFRQIELRRPGCRTSERSYFSGKSYSAEANAHWKTTNEGLERLVKADRLDNSGESTSVCRNFMSD